MQLSPLRLPAQVIQLVQVETRAQCMMPLILYLVSMAREPKGAVKLQMCVKHGKAGNYTPGGTLALKYQYAFQKVTATRLNALM